MPQILVLESIGVCAAADASSVDRTWHEIDDIRDATRLQVTREVVRDMPKLVPTNRRSTSHEAIVRLLVSDQSTPRWPQQEFRS
jgi:hypothetical protein